MKRYLLYFAVILASISALAIGSFAAEDLDDSNLRIFEGNVTAVDVGGDTLTVNGAMPITFNISRDTKLVTEVDIYAQDIKLSDISRGDYVKVSYVREGQKSRIPDRVLKVSVEHGAKDIEATEE